LVFWDTQFLFFASEKYKIKRVLLLSLSHQPADFCRKGGILMNLEIVTDRKMVSGTKNHKCVKETVLRGSSIHCGNGHSCNKPYKISPSKDF
jgi:hypothetical protein